MKFQLWLGVFLIVLRYGIHETRGLSSGSTLSICNGTLKSGNLLYKLSFVKTQSLRTVLDSSFEDSLIQSNPDQMSKYVTSGILSKVFLSPMICYILKYIIWWHNKISTPKQLEMVTNVVNFHDNKWAFRASSGLTSQNFRLF